MAGTENVRRNERKELVMILSFDQSVKLIYGENALASLGEIAEVIEAETFQQFNPRKMTAADALVILKKMYGVEE